MNRKINLAYELGDIIKGQRATNSEETQELLDQVEAFQVVAEARYEFKQTARDIFIEKASIAIHAARVAHEGLAYVIYARDSLIEATALWEALQASKEGK